MQTLNDFKIDTTSQWYLLSIPNREDLHDSTNLSSQYSRPCPMGSHSGASPSVRQHNSSLFDAGTYFPSLPTHIHTPATNRPSPFNLSVDLTDPSSPHRRRAVPTISRTLTTIASLCCMDDVEVRFHLRTAPSIHPQHDTPYPFLFPSLARSFPLFSRPNSHSPCNAPSLKRAGEETSTALKSVSRRAVSPPSRALVAIARPLATHRRAYV